MVSLVLSARSLSTLSSLPSVLSPGLFQRVWFVGCQGIGRRHVWGADKVCSQTGFLRNIYGVQTWTGEGWLLQGACLCTEAPLGQGVRVLHCTPAWPELLGTYLPDPAFLFSNLNKNLKQASCDVPAQKVHCLGLLLPFHLAKADHPPSSGASADFAACWAPQWFHHCLTSAGKLWRSGLRKSVGSRAQGSGQLRKTISRRTSVGVRCQLPPESIV